MTGLVLAVLLGFVVPLSWSVANGGTLRFRMENDQQVSEIREYYAGTEKVIVSPARKRVSQRIAALVEEEGLAEVLPALESVAKENWSMSDGPKHKPQYSVTGDTSLTLEEANELVAKLPGETERRTKGLGYVSFQGKTPKRGLTYSVFCSGSPPGKPKDRWLHFSIDVP